VAVEGDGDAPLEVFCPPILGHRAAAKGKEDGDRCSNAKARGGAGTRPWFAAVAPASADASPVVPLAGWARV
jgi:hypothetical protein